MAAVYLVLTEEFYGGGVKSRAFSTRPDAEKYVKTMEEHFDLDIIILESKLGDTNLEVAIAVDKAMRKQFGNESKPGKTNKSNKGKVETPPKTVAK